MIWFECPYLNGHVELTDERERHIAEAHPDLLPGLGERLAQTLADPDRIRRSVRSSRTRLFSRRVIDVRGGKHVVVVVVSDAAPGGRHWIITAYVARRLAEGRTEWNRG